MRQYVAAFAKLRVLAHAECTDFCGLNCTVAGPDRDVPLRSATQLLRALFCDVEHSPHVLPGHCFKLECSEGKCESCSLSAVVPANEKECTGDMFTWKCLNWPRERWSKDPLAAASAAELEDEQEVLRASAAPVDEGDCGPRRGGRNRAASARVRAVAETRAALEAEAGAAARASSRKPLLDELMRRLGRAQHLGERRQLYKDLERVVVDHTWLANMLRRRELQVGAEVDDSDDSDDGGDDVTGPTAPLPAATSAAADIKVGDTVRIAYVEADSVFFQLLNTCGIVVHIVPPSKAQRTEAVRYEVDVFSFDAAMPTMPVLFEAKNLAPSSTPRLHSANPRSEGASGIGVALAGGDDHEGGGGGAGAGAGAGALFQIP